MDAMTTPDPGRERYRRGQRRRALIAWSVLGLVVVGIGLATAFGGGDGDGSDLTSVAGLLPAEMSASAYTVIHKGQSEAEVLGLIGVPGQREAEIEPEYLQLLPSSPAGTSCEFWRISEAPNHIVRLCFGGTPASLEQKSVAAKGEDAAPETLA
jgi:hypothetical protein